ncbi:acyl--CoA ligase [Mycolicibacterium boenickei]|nr:acyl--CoA ligase [Mycolicibacterium boenickei]
MAGADLPVLNGDTVGEALADLARDSPADPALIWLTAEHTQSMSWSELHHRACNAADALLSMNPSRGRVALVSPNTVDWIVAMYGCALAGMPVVPVAPSVTDTEAAHFLSHARVAVVLAVNRVADSHVLARMQSVACAIETKPIVCDISGVTAKRQPCVPSQIAVDCDDEFLVQFTSGTTGLPKAAVLSHRAAMGAARAYGETFGLKHGDPYLNPLPLHHVGGSVSGVIVTLGYGGVYPVIERFTPETAVRAFREIRPVLVGLVPTMLIDLLNQPGVREGDFTSVRTVVGGATTVDPNLIDELEHRLGITFAVAYGQSEAPMLAASSPNDPAWIRTRTLGRCLAGRDYTILDADGNTASTGVSGELCVRGPLVMSGYLQPDGSVDPARDQQGWLHTGDLCTMDDAGVLTFRGRIREVIIRGGENVYPAEVEQVLSSHDQISEVVVFGVRDERLGERVVAAVIPTPDKQLDVATLEAFAASQLSRFKRPTEWIVAATLPRTSTGKVRKHVLSGWHEDGTIAMRCSSPPTLTPRPD